FENVCSLRLYPVCYITQHDLHYVIKKICSLNNCIFMPFYAFNSSTWGVDTGRTEVQGYLWLYSKLEDNSTRQCFKSN
ncbi:hypothetical protein ACQP3J_34020, partial [Escherichia coli]